MRIESNLVLVLGLAVFMGCQTVQHNGHGKATGAASVSMPWGVDDAGSAKPIFDDPNAQRAFDEMGFDFLSYHLGRLPLPDETKQVDAWARAHTMVGRAQSNSSFASVRRSGG